MRIKCGWSAGLVMAVVVGAITIAACSDDQGGSTAQTGYFGLQPVSGVTYEAGRHQGVTGEDGEFQYRGGDHITFYLGDVVLGSALAMEVVEELDVAGGVDDELGRQINMVRLLWTLDADEDRSNGVRLLESAQDIPEDTDLSDESSLQAAVDAVAPGRTLLGYEEVFQEVVEHAEARGMSFELVGHYEMFTGTAMDLTRFMDRDCPDADRWDRIEVDVSEIDGGYRLEGVMESVEGREDSFELDLRGVTGAVRSANDYVVAVMIDRYEAEEVETGNQVRAVMGIKIIDDESPARCVGIHYLRSEEVENVEPVLYGVIDGGRVDRPSCLLEAQEQVQERLIRIPGMDPDGYFPQPARVTVTRQNGEVIGPMDSEPLGDGDSIWKPHDRSLNHKVTIPYDCRESCQDYREVEAEMTDNDGVTVVHRWESSRIGESCGSNGGSGGGGDLLQEIGQHCQVLASNVGTCANLEMLDDCDTIVSEADQIANQSGNRQQCLETYAGMVSCLSELSCQRYQDFVEGSSSAPCQMQEQALMSACD